MSLGGTRVSSSFSLPLTDASVSVATSGGALADVRDRVGLLGVHLHL